MSRERIDIADLLRRLGIDARKKAKEWHAICPNPEHEDHSPSWRIRDDPGATKHGYHKCWPCGFQGGVLDLIQRVRGFGSREEARVWLDGEIPEGGKEVGGVEVEVRPPSFGFRLPPEVILAPIEDWPSEPRKYLEKRGVQDWQVERWGIGYAVAGRLKGRIVFVLRDAKGRSRGYSSRTFIEDPKRFLEPEMHENFDPSAMFGEQHWPPVAQRRRGEAIFVFEGAIKGLAAEAALPGCYFGATTGSEMRSMHPVKLSTFSRVCLVGDDDKAGDRVSSMLYAALCRHCEPERLKLPEGKDADELPPNVLARSMIEWLRRR